MHRSTVASIVGAVCRFLRWLAGSCVNMTPGERIFSGSASRFSVHISFVSLDPHSRSMKGAILRPVPCSALSEPSDSMAASTVLGFERAVVFVDDQLDDISHECIEARDFMLQPCIPEYLADVARMTGNHNNLWEEAIGTCVGGEADKVDRSCEHLSSAKQGDEILAQ